MNNLHWILEPATRPSDEEGKVYEEVIGRRPDYLVALYMGAEETESGFRNTLMICIKNQGERDYVSHVATDEHRARFPRAFKWWDARQNTPAKVDIRLLPGITPAEVAELDKMKLGDVGALCEAQVPDHLAPWKTMALRLRTLSKPRVRLEEGALVAA